MTQVSRHVDLELRIGRAPDGGYALEMTLDREQEFAAAPISPELEGWRPTAGSPEADGAALFELLFADPALRARWAEIRGQCPDRRVRLRVDLDAPALHALPWEALYDPEAKVHLASSVATPFSRYRPAQWRRGGPIVKRPIRVLVVIADPDFAGSGSELAPIDADQEWAAIDQATAQMQKAGTVELVRMPGPCTLSAVEAALREGCHVLHYVGHGAFSKRKQRAVVFMADEANQVALVDSDDFATMLANQLGGGGALREDQLRMVFMCSCESGSQSAADAFLGFAPQLVDAGVPAVVAMQDKVPMDTARAFIETFYGRLLVHGRVDLASNEARATLTTAKLPGASMPVLNMRLRSGELLGFKGEISSGRADEFWPFLFRNVAERTCVPILGPGATEGLQDSPETIAAKLAGLYEINIPDPTNLARVAAFAQSHDDATLRRDHQRALIGGLRRALGVPLTPRLKAELSGADLAQATAALKWAERVGEQVEDEPHRLLAELGLPLYLTTNPGSMMFAALQAEVAQRGGQAHRAQPQWKKTDAGTPQYRLNPAPSPTDPYVFHLNGWAGDPNFVLSERDYLRHFARITHEPYALLPSNVVRPLTEHCLLLLGFSLEDWAFRVVVEGLLEGLPKRAGGGRLRVGVQYDSSDPGSSEDIRRTLQRHLSSAHQIDIYWGSVRQFISELHAGSEPLRRERDATHLGPDADTPIEEDGGLL